MIHTVANKISVSKPNWSNSYSYPNEVIIRLQGRGAHQRSLCPVKLFILYRQLGRFDEVIDHIFHVGRLQQLRWGNGHLKTIMPVKKRKVVTWFSAFYSFSQKKNLNNVDLDSGERYRWCEIVAGKTVFKTLLASRKATFVNNKNHSERTAREAIQFGSVKGNAKERL